MRAKSTVDIVEQDKERKKLKDNNKIQKLAHLHSKIEDNARKKEHMHQEKVIYSELQRTIKLYRYENVK